MSVFTVYGIKNCDTVKKAIAWLKAHDVEFSFHDYKTKGISRAKLEQWCAQVGWESLLNRKGMTWRQLDEATKSSIVSQSEAVALMLEKTSVIRRPLIENETRVTLVGFDEAEYKKRFDKK